MTDKAATDDDREYRHQLKAKIDRFRQLMAPLSDLGPEVFDSPGEGYRMRAEFKIWQEDDRAHYAMYRPGEYKKPYRIDRFPPGHERINHLMPIVLEAINASDTLRRKLFQMEYLTTLNGQTLISLLYHKKLDDDWEEQARTLRDRLGIDIIGRARKQKRVLDRDYVMEKLRIDGRVYQYQQIESTFTQPNAIVCEKMIQWAVDNSRNNGGDLVELYCGNGNFTLPLAQNFNRVLATELAKASVRSAIYNQELNGVDNITLARMSSEEFSQALDKEREFFRLRHVDLDSYDFSTIFVDPPRAGMDPHTVSVTQRFDNIIYISCNPDTLKRDLETICQTHRIEKLALFDQFPFTDHIECGAILKKR